MINKDSRVDGIPVELFQILKDDGIQKDGNDNPVCERAKETQMYRTVFGTGMETDHFQACGHC